MQLEFNSTYFIIFSLISFFSTFFITRYSKFFFSGSLLDKDFLKPQAFHKTAVARSGGLSIIISLVIFFLGYYYLYEKVLIDYIFLSISIFTLGFLDDLKFKISPFLRLAIMLIIILFLINFFNIHVEKVDLSFLNNLLKINFFYIGFTLLCFLFIINGANLIDGYNGLLTIQLIIINSFLLLLNINQGNNDFTIIILAQIITLFIFLLFNFPKAKIFLGDSGAYLFGSLTALNVIKMNNLNENISSFFFFSFFRKIMQKKNPLKPDRLHLHMVLYNFLKDFKKIKDGNFLTSIIINSSFLLLVLPAFYYRYSSLFCKLWFFSLLFFYLLSYFMIKKKQLLSRKN
jgi:UDP-GlcNAc:undecaprenyl-phosphate GlcNAc-1-phosphate transferase